MSRGDPRALLTGAYDLASRGVSRVTGLIRGTRGAADDMAAAAAQPGKLRRFLTGAGLGTGGGALGFLANALFRGSDRGEGTGAGIDTGDPGLGDGAVRGRDATSRSPVVLVDFASMIKNVPAQVTQLNDVQMNVNFGETNLITTDNLAIKYDIEEMFDKEQGELIIPELTKISVTSPEIDGIQRALLRTAANLQLLNTQIGTVNTRLDSFEEAIKNADDRNRRALLEAERQRDEDEAESSNDKKGLIATNIEQAKEAVKAGLAVIATGLLGAAVGAVAYYLGDGLEKYADDDPTNDEDAEDSFATSSTIGASLAAGGAAALQNRRTVRAQKAAVRAVNAIPGVSDDVVRVAGQSGALQARIAAAREVSEALARSGGQETAEVIAKKASVEAISEAIERMGPRLAAAGAGKSIPVIGSLLGAGFTVAKLWQGDYVGATIEAAATAASLTAAGGPLLGPAITTGIIAREVYGAVYADENGDPVYPEEDAYRATRLPEVVDATSEWVKDWLQGEVEKLPGEIRREARGTRENTVINNSTNSGQSRRERRSNRNNTTTDSVSEASIQPTPTSSVSATSIQPTPTSRVENIREQVRQQRFLTESSQELRMSRVSEIRELVRERRLASQTQSEQSPVVIPLVVPAATPRRAPQPISATSGEGPVSYVENPMPHRTTSDSYSQRSNYS